MSAQIEWFEPQVLLYTVSSPFTWRELAATTWKAIEMAQAQSAQEVGTIIDVSGVRQLPSGVFLEGFRILRNKPRNANVVVVVGASPRIKSLYEVIKGISSTLSEQVFFLATIEEAVALLHTKLGHHDLPPAEDNAVADVKIESNGQMPSFKNSATQNLYERIVTDSERFNAWVRRIDGVIEDAEIFYLTEQFVQELPDLNVDRASIDWIALITELFSRAAESSTVSNPVR